MIQGAWSVTGASGYVAHGGEFPAVNGKPQQGLVRFATRAVAPHKVAPEYSAGLTPKAVVLAPGSNRISFTTTSDKDNLALTYRLYRKPSHLNDGTPVCTVSDSSPFWKPRTITCRDDSAPIGASTPYHVEVTDGDGNVTVGSATNLTGMSGTVGDRAYPNAVPADSPNAY